MIWTYHFVVDDINGSNRRVAYVPSLNVKAADNGDSGCGSHLRTNDLTSPSHRSQAALQELVRDMVVI